MPRRIYPTVAEAMEMHRLVIEEFGGIHGIRDQKPLESAIYRPQTAYYETLVDGAAALMESLANNRPFLDGNKRVAVLITDVFLRSNRFFMGVDQLKAYEFFSGSLERHRFRFAAIRDWLASNRSPLEEE